ncbi:unnamed protein product [Hymenolepis diminuta]|uniref:Translation initiation factor eIF2B subunit alpha n=1 Tax=Hymenolepis diminuta TaxID=6216 RepID=A0A0R3SJP3_HYMDI|nr:unnamed protein product [Hymenolepis diminuta]
MLVVPAKDINANVASEVTIDYDESMDVGKIFADRCRERRDTSEGIIAIEVLICLMKCRNIRTVQGLDEMVNDAVKKLQQTDESNCSVKSACDIFQHFITMANLDETVSYEQLKKMLLDRARMYLRKMRGFRDNIARNTNHLIGSNFKLLTHAKSRNVAHSLSYIVNNEKNPRPLHCYVTQSMPSKSGELMVRELTKHGVSCTLVPDTALGYIMPEIDAVVLGAEAVVESGGVLNALGSCSVAMIAHALRKPVYVLVESFKFLRVYPFNQFYIPDELKWKYPKQPKVPSIAKRSEDVGRCNEDEITKTSTSKYDAWVNIKNQSSKKLVTEVPNIDYTSPNYITALITDLGILDTAAIHIMGRLFLLFCVIVAHASSAAYSSQTPGGNRLLILFLDGLRHNYFEYLDETGGVNQMRMGGCHVPKVKPVFPSNCFSNVHALFAGRESLHFSDFNASTEVNYTHRDLLWYRAAAEGKNVNLYHFPFCSGVIEKGLNCIPRRKYRKYPLKSTLATALHSLINKTTDLAVVYYEEIDEKGHLRGSSMDVMMENDTMFKIDEAILDVVEYIKEHPEENINFAIVSDHGMMDFNGFVTIDVFFLWRDVEHIVNLGSVAGIWPTNGSENSLEWRLRSPNRRFNLYTPKTLPGNAWPSSELAPYLLIPFPGYLLHVNYYPNSFADHFNPEKLPKKPRGAHGYSSDVEDMHTTFLAYGPAFSQGCEIKNKDNFFTYDVFPIIQKALFSESPPLPATSKTTESNITTISDTTSTTTTIVSTPPKPEAITGTEQLSGWEIKMVVGVIVAAFVIILLIGLVTRRILRMRQRQVDRICLVEDLADAEFQAGHYQQEDDYNKGDLRV